MATETNPISKNSKAEKRRTKKAPKKITPTYLHNSGLFYLERFHASSGHFRTVMLRKVKKSCFHHKDQNYEECAALVDDLVKKFTDAGLLNDELYLQGMVNSYKRKGLSERMILQKLTMKKLPKDGIQKCLEAYNAENGTSHSELHSAVITCRKKRIGGFATSENSNFQKDLEKLGRAGFSYDIAKKVLEMDKEELENIFYDTY